MSGWLLPGAAAAFWAGLIAWTAAGPTAPVTVWLVAGVGTLLAGAAAAPRVRSGPGSLEGAGLLGERRPAALTVVAPEQRLPGLGPPALAVALVCAGMFMLGVGWGGVHDHRVAGDVLRRLGPRGVELVATLRTDPSPGQFGWYAVADVSEVRWSSGALAIREPVWVQSGDDPPSAVRGDRVLLRGSLGDPDDPGFARSLRRRGIPAEIRVARFEWLGPSEGLVLHAAQDFRRFVGRTIRRLFPSREAGLLMGLALGDDSRLDPGVARDFQATGLGHLLVVSGENVAMVLAPVLCLAALIRLRRVPRLLLGLGTVVFFVVLTGAEPSVMRAGVMAGLTLAGVFLGRPRTTGSILAGAVLILVVLDPTLVWAIGFQLSVAATAGMVVLATPLAERLRFLPRPIALAAGTTLAAQLGVSPILLYHFHEVPAVTLLANVLAFPAVSPALLLGLLAGVLGIASLPVGRAVAALALLPMRYLELLADRLARAPVPWITSRGGLGVLVGGGAAVVGLVWWLRSRRRLPRPAVVVAFVLLPAVVWSGALAAGPPSGLVIHFFDVGQGDAALVTTPDGANVLIDAGPDPVEVATKLSALGVKRIDLAVATHPHADHVEGFPAIFARFPTSLVLDPGCDEPSPSYTEFLQAVREEDLPVRRPRAGETLAVGDLRIDVLAPRACAHGNDSDPNNDSLILRLTYREDVVLFPGDAEEPSQQVLLDDRVSLGAEVLKVPHHGGATSLVDFFNAVDPRLAIVSVGPNDYGHPVPEILAELRATGSRVLRTDRRGDVTVTFAPEGLLVQSGR